MNRISLQLAVGLLLCITTSYATITREGARDFVLNQIVTDRIGNVNCYYLMNLLQLIQMYQGWDTLF
jgi:hypothetical protein